MIPVGVGIDVIHLRLLGPQRARPMVPVTGALTPKSFFRKSRIPTK